jgi:hypothetical protein
VRKLQKFVGDANDSEDNPFLMMMWLLILGLQHCTVICWARMHQVVLQRQQQGNQKVSSLESAAHRANQRAGVLGLTPCNRFGCEDMGLREIFHKGAVKDMYWLNHHLKPGGFLDREVWCVECKFLSAEDLYHAIKERGWNCATSVKSEQGQPTRVNTAITRIVQDVCQHA